MTDILAHSLCSMESQANLKALVIISKSGLNARVVSRYRPGIPIIVFTYEPKIKRQLSLFRGVQSFVLNKPHKDLESFLEFAEDFLKNLKFVQRNDRFAILAYHPFARDSWGEGVNFIKLHRVGS